jgi:hypothetical protein
MNDDCPQMKSKQGAVTERTSDGGLELCGGRMMDLNGMADNFVVKRFEIFGKLPETLALHWFNPPWLIYLKRD